MTIKFTVWQLSSSGEIALELQNGRAFFSLALWEAKWSWAPPSSTLHNIREKKHIHTNFKNKEKPKTIKLLNQWDAAVGGYCCRDYPD